MPHHVIGMLDGIQNNGGTDDIKALGAGVREILTMIEEDREVRTKKEIEDRKSRESIKECIVKATICLDKHIANTEIHTPKGIILRKSVIGWLVLAMVLVSGFMYYVPDLAKWIIGLL